MNGSLPFSRDQFLAVFASYNEAVWPAEPLAYGLAIVALAALVRRGERYQKLAGLVLAAMWLWTGVAYHWLFFAPVNSAARLFALLFVVQSLWLLVATARRGGLRLRWQGSLSDFAGAALILYAMILYPAVGALNGDTWPRMPAFGITPCPVTLFTLGMLLFARRPGGLWIVPSLWAVVGGSATFALGMVQDALLLVAGPITAAILIRHAWQRRLGRAAQTTI